MTDTPTPNPAPTPEPSPSGTPSANGFDANRPTIISLLYLGSFLTGISGLVGIVLAHVWSGENDEAWMASHYQYLIRTFWFGLLASVILGITVIGLVIIWVPWIWVGIRSVMSLIKAQKKEPMPDPTTFLL